MRYTARAPQAPTNRAPNEPASPICAKKSIFLGKNGRFWAKHFEWEQKFWYPYIRKPLRRLARLVLLVGHGTNGIRTANIWPKMTKNGYDQYTQGYNFPIWTTPKKISISMLWVIFQGSPRFLAILGDSNFAIINYKYP